MIDFFFPELIEVTVAVRRRDARSVRIEREDTRSRQRGPGLRQRLAAMLGGIALSVHPEAARASIGLCCCPDPTET
jgi:hypothetical protein